MNYIDYYKILEINNTASPVDIKNAYRKLARKYHPDLHPNDKDAKSKFQQINEANDVLSNKEKRAKYDKYGKDWQHSEEFEKAKAQQSSNSQQRRYSNSPSEDDFSDFFESMFGNSAGRGQQVKYRGEDYNAEIQLNLIDVLKKHQQTLTVNRKNIRITIPAGIENGQTIKISNHGGLGVNGGPNGDLYIKFAIANDSKIKRLGDNLYLTTDLDMFTAVLGGEITIETLTGKVKLKVAPETQNGTKIKLKGKGFPIYKNEGHFGDLLITYSIKIPTNLTENQKVLFSELSHS
ncbi:MAG: J domain-containing protein [Bacteroidota bacterium]